MIKNIVVEVEPRSETGTNACRRMRAADKVPAVVYGLDRPPVIVAVSPQRIEEVLKLETGRNTIFTLSLARESGKRRAVMIREIQRDPVTEGILHLDFVRVDLEKKITVNVPVQLVGTPEGVKNEGGIVDFVHRQVEVQCLPVDIPEHLDVDISGLHINQNVSVGDLQAGDNVEVLTVPETIIAVVTAPRAEAVAEEAKEEEEAAPEAEEPEVIKKGKEAEPAEETEEKGE